MDRLVAAGGERWRLDKMANRIAYVRQVRFEIAIMCIHIQKDEYIDRWDRQYGQVHRLRLAGVYAIANSM